MHFFILLLTFGALHQQVTGGLHHLPYRPCHCDGFQGKRRFIRAALHNGINTEDNQRNLLPNWHPNPHSNHNLAKGNVDSRITELGSNPANLEVDGQTSGDESELVGFGPIARLLTAGVKARAKARVVAARARLHHPRLLEETPSFLDSSEVQQSEEHLQNPDARQAFSPKQEFQHPPLVPNQRLKGVTTQSSTLLDNNSLQNQPFTRPHIFTPAETANTNLRFNDNDARPSSEEEIFDEEFARSNGYYENQHHLNFLPASTNPQPEVIIHNIDNSAEVYQNLKPGFSIIPTDWKPPPESSLYVQGEYEPVNGQEPILAVLPGKWTNDDGQDIYYYEDYEVVPIPYIADDVDEDFYGRSADTTENVTTSKIVNMKNQLEDWKKNPMVWRPDSTSPQSQPSVEKSRAADPSQKRTFKGHKSHVHTIIHQHVHSHGQPFIPSHSSGFQFQNPHLVQPIAHIPVQHSGFSQSHAQGQSFGFASHTPQLTINNQKTTVLVPSGGHQNVEIAQIAGSNNAVSQSQASNRGFQSGFVNGAVLPQTGQNFQSAQIIGNNNALSQSQAANQGFFRRDADGFLGAPYIINFPRRSEVWRTHEDFMQRPRRKRSIDTSFDNALETGSKISRNISDILLHQSKLLKQIQETAKEDKDLLFITEMGSDLLDDFEGILKSRNITKRSVPLLRLIADPNAKLDVPKTLENMGTVARKSFESKRAPMYHLKNAASSAKDVVLSSLRVIPQDLIVSSKYKIIDRERENVVQAQNPMLTSTKQHKDRLGAINPTLFPGARLFRNKSKTKQNAPKEVSIKQPKTLKEPEDPHNFGETFKRVGSMLRQSVQSGHETMAHVGEIYHSLRKAVATTRHVAPKAILSSMRIPAVQHPHSLLPKRDNLLLITPKILQYKQEAVGAPHYSDNMEDFVGVGHIMNSLGISNPDADNLQFRRIVLHPANIPKPLLEKPSLLPRIPPPDLQARSNFIEEENPVVDMKKLKRYFLLADTIKEEPEEEVEEEALDEPLLEEEPPEEDVQETMAALENAREAVGANSLKEFILQMKEGLSNLFKDKLEEARIKLSHSLGKDKYKGKIVLERKQRPSASVERNNNKNQAKATTEKGSVNSEEMEESNAINETVGAGLLLPKQLLQPFMGQPSKNERRQFFEEYGDSIEPDEDNESEEIIGFNLPLNKTRIQAANSRKNKQGTVGAINPIIFTRDFDPLGGQSSSKSVAVKNATRHKVNEGGKCNSTSKVVNGNSSDELANIENSAEVTTKDNSTKVIEEMWEKFNQETHANKSIMGLAKKMGKNSNAANFESSEVNNQHSDELRTSMKMGKKLLTPFMGKPTKEMMEKFFGKFDESYENDAGYLGIPRDVNLSELQALSDAGSRKRAKGPSGRSQKIDLDGFLDENVL